MKAPDILSQAADTYRERNKVYGDNYKEFGKVMAALFPDGLTIRTITDWNRLGILIQIVSKLTRYVQNFQKGGHQDSIHDTVVYSAMLEELDMDLEALGELRDSMKSPEEILRSIAEGRTNDTE